MRRGSGRVRARKRDLGDGELHLAVGTLIVAGQLHGQLDRLLSWL